MDPSAGLIRQYDGQRSIPEIIEKQRVEAFSAGTGNPSVRKRTA
jgi:hypothetical protein